jgi:hypothetical protein
VKDILDRVISALGARGHHHRVADAMRAIRQRRREEILGANVADFRAFADALAELTAYGQVVVFGSEQAIQAANSRRPGLLRVSKVV